MQILRADCLIKGLECFFPRALRNLFPVCCLWYFFMRGRAERETGRGREGKGERKWVRNTATLPRYIYEILPRRAKIFNTLSCQTVSEILRPRRYFAMHFAAATYRTLLQRFSRNIWSWRRLCLSPRARWTTTMKRPARRDAINYGRRASPVRVLIIN